MHKGPGQKLILDAMIFGPSGSTTLKTDMIL